MKIEHIAKIKTGRQDGAFFGGYLFSFDHEGNCSVYEAEELNRANGNEARVFAEFVLDKTDMIMPHSNTVMFGNEYYNEEDEFPLLYTNIYNNYAKSEDKKIGMCLVYRLQRENNSFISTLVQIIEIGFTDNEDYWKSTGKDNDVRPYGNFTIDREKGVYYAFTMRDKSNTTRYFAFNLPKLGDGEICETCGVPKVILQISDIKEYFDCEYHHYIQGACCYNGKIYSLEGFTGSVDNPPALRVIDTDTKRMVDFKHFEDFGMNIEPEMIDFYNGTCYYGEHNGNIYKLFF